MEKIHKSHLLLFSSLYLFLPSNAEPQTSHGYKCAASSHYPCQSFAFYRAGADASLLDLASVADLFSVSRLMIARATNITADAPLCPNQPLLIPIPCSCASNRSFAAAPYQILAGDTFYVVSSFKFGNLTSYPAVEDANPSLLPTNLTIGVLVTFPIFCSCPPNRSQSIITYSLQPSDSYPSIASAFGCDLRSLISLNGPEGSLPPYSTILIPVSQPPLSTRIYSPHLPPPPSAAAIVVRKNREGAVVGMGIALGIMGLLCLLQLLVIGRGLRRRNRRTGEKPSSSGDKKAVMDVAEWLDKYKVYRIDELREATAGFDTACLIRGSVYRGEIDGEVYAIKKMKWNASEELKILQKVNHINLVKLEGFSIEAESGSCYLVYEYVENGSLHSWLQDPDLRRKLGWPSRLRIAVDIANGLQYIHEHAWPRVVHKDIKTTNVLLDAHMRAKIANFGLARTGRNAATAHIVGTQGYAAPEYVAEGLVGTKMDVFAYGVVLLELVSGREAAPMGGRALWAEAQEGVLAVGALRVGRLLAWMDEALAEQSCPMDSVATVMNIARACLQRDPANRPTMVEVAYALARAEEQSFFSGDGVSMISACDADLVARWHSEAEGILSRDVDSLMQTCTHQTRLRMRLWT